MTAEARTLNVGAEVEKARHALAAADQLLAIGLWDDAMSRLYYATFHLASAALLVHGIEAQSHRALLSLVSLHLVKSGHVPAACARELTELFGLRNQADYDRHFATDAESAGIYRAKAAHVLQELDSVLVKGGHDSMLPRVCA
jgi:uncharacterized protein (UPF0332 family)